MFGHSYGLRKVDCLVKKINKDMGAEIELEPITKTFGFCLYATGCRLIFHDSKYSLSVQTDASVAGDSFCETALICDDNIMYDGTLGYNDVIRHYDIEDFENHLIELFRLIRNSTDKDMEVS